MSLAARPGPTYPDSPAPRARSRSGKTATSAIPRQRTSTSRPATVRNARRQVAVLAVATALLGLGALAFTVRSSQHTAYGVTNSGATHSGVTDYGVTDYGAANYGGAASGLVAP